MNDTEFAKKAINILCQYFGEMTVFELFVERWGVQNLYDVLSELMIGDGIDEKETSGEG